MTISEEKKNYLEAAGVKDLEGLEKSLTDGKTLAESLGLESKAEGDVVEGADGSDATEEVAPVVVPDQKRTEVHPVAPEVPAPVAPVVTPVEAAPIAPVTPALPVEDAPAEDGEAAGEG